MNRVHFVDLIPLDKIIPDANPVRTLDPDHIRDLIDSLNILKMGPLDPLIVKPMPDGLFMVLSGNHRYMALLEGGWKEAPCHVIEPHNDAEEFMMKLHANTKRKNLNDLEACEALVREKAIYEAFYPEARHGGNRNSPCMQFAHTAHKGYGSLKAKSLGINRSTLQRDLQVGAIVQEIPELKEAKATKTQVLCIAQRRPEERTLLRQALQQSHKKPETLRSFLRTSLTPSASEPTDDAEAARQLLLQANRLFRETLALLRNPLPWTQAHAPQLRVYEENERLLQQLSEYADHESRKLRQYMEHRD